MQLRQINFIVFHIIASLLENGFIQQDGKRRPKVHRAEKNEEKFFTSLAENALQAAGYGKIHG